MKNPYKNAQFMQGPQAMHIPQFGLGRSMPVEKTAHPGRLEKKLLNAMDHFFTMVILLSGEEADEVISIGHIL